MPHFLICSWASFGCSCPVFGFCKQCFSKRRCRIVSVECGFRLFWVCTRSRLYGGSMFSLVFFSGTSLLITLFTLLIFIPPSSSVQVFLSLCPYQYFLLFDLFLIVIYYLCVYECVWVYECVCGGHELALSFSHRIQELNMGGQACKVSSFTGSAILLASW